MKINLLWRNIIPEGDNVEARCNLATIPTIADEPGRNGTRMGHFFIADELEDIINAGR